MHLFLTLYCLINVSTPCYLPVIIKTENGRNNMFLKTESSFAIEHIKSMIRDKKGIPSDAVTLRWSEKQLEDGHTLNYYNIPDGSILYMHIKGNFICVYSTGQAHTNINMALYSSYLKCKSWRLIA